MAASKQTIQATVYCFTLLDKSVMLMMNLRRAQFIRFRTYCSFNSILNDSFLCVCVCLYLSAINCFDCIWWRQFWSVVHFISCYAVQWLCNMLTVHHSWMCQSWNLRIRNTLTRSCMRRRVCVSIQCSRCCCINTHTCHVCEHGRPIIIIIANYIQLHRWRCTAPQFYFIFRFFSVKVHSFH